VRSRARQARRSTSPRDKRSRHSPTIALRPEGGRGDRVAQFTTVTTRQPSPSIGIQGGRAVGPAETPSPSGWTTVDQARVRTGNQLDMPLRTSETPLHAHKPQNMTPTVNTPVRDVTAKMAIAIAEALDRLPGSPGEHYLASRGIPLEVAQTLQLGWTDKGDLAGRVIFPLRDPLGQPTSATGRSVNDRTMPKYRTLPVAKGYMKTLFNGGAISVVRESGHPLVIVEGPIDAAACAAAGIPCVVAINGADYGHPEHFAGVRSAILAFDADEAGQKARRSVGLALISQGVDYVSLPAAAFEGSKDLGEFWQQHGTLPEQLVARVMGPHSLTRITPIVSSPQ